MASDTPPIPDGYAYLLNFFNALISFHGMLLVYICLLLSLYLTYRVRQGESWHWGFKAASGMFTIVALLTISLQLSLKAYLEQTRSCFKFVIPTGYWYSNLNCAPETAIDSLVSFPINLTLEAIHLSFGSWLGALLLVLSLLSFLLHCLTFPFLSSDKRKSILRRALYSLSAFIAILFFRYIDIVYY